MKEDEFDFEHVKTEVSARYYIIVELLLLLFLSKWRNLGEKKIEEGKWSQSEIRFMHKSCPYPLLLLVLKFITETTGRDISSVEHEHTC